MNNFISAHDVTDIDSLVQSAMAYKADPLKDKHLGAHKRVGMLFLNPSMRTPSFDPDRGAEPGCGTHCL